MGVFIRWVSRHWHSGRDEQIRNLERELESTRGELMISKGMVAFLTNGIATQEFALQKIRNHVAPSQQ